MDCALPAVHEPDVGPQIPCQHHPATNTQGQALSQIAGIRGFNSLGTDTLVLCLDLNGGAVQAKHVLVVVLDDLGLGGIDAKRIGKAVNLHGREPDRASRSEELPGGY